jgi:hypothetical protein
MRTFLLILLLAVLSPVAARAAQIDIYSGEAAVADKSAAESKRALPQALQHVLVKMSGLRNFDEYPQVEPALAIAPEILISFHYRTVEVPAADGSTNEQLRLVGRFAANKVDELARTLQLPLWPAMRTPTQIWVVVDDGLDRRIMPLEFEYARRAMDDAAWWRGLPVSWPMADEQGEYEVDPQLLWGGYTEDLAIDTDSAAMIVAARREGPQWSVRSNLTYGGQSWNWRLQNIDLQAALTENVQQAADLVASANTIAATDLGTSVYDLTVTGLRGAADYARCLEYLQQLEIVDQVAVLSARPATVAFRLELSALPRYLEDTLLDGAVLGFDEARKEYILINETLTP